MPRNSPCHCGHGSPEPTDALPNYFWAWFRTPCRADTSPVRQAGSTMLFWKLREFNSKVVGWSGLLDPMPMVWKMFNSLTQI